MVIVTSPVATKVANTLLFATVKLILSGCVCAPVLLSFHAIVASFLRSEKSEALTERTDILGKLSYIKPLRNE